MVDVLKSRYEKFIFPLSKPHGFRDGFCPFSHPLKSSVCLCDPSSVHFVCQSCLLLTCLPLIEILILTAVVIFSKK